MTAEETFWELARPLLTDPAVSRSTMMGLPCLRRDGRFFASLDRRTQALVVKLPEHRVSELIKAGRGEPFAPAGRVFREWVAITQAGRRHWRSILQEAFTHSGPGNTFDMPVRKDMPSTLKRSPKQAQETYAKAHDAAVESYGEGERAHRTAFSAVKHSFEKVGDHWEPKDGKGPSDAQAARTRQQKSVGTAGGVNANASKEHLMEVAKKLDIRGRTRMTKEDLVDAIQKANDRSTRKARGA